MTMSPAPYIADAVQLLGLAAVLAVALGLTGLGALAGGPRRTPELDMVVGWGTAYVVVVVGGVLSPLPLTWFVVILAAAGVVGLAVTGRRDGRLLPAAWLRVGAMGAVLLLVVAGLTPSQWDEYSHWLSAGRYLVAVDAFPGHGRPPTIAEFPAYPFGVPMIAYLASRAAGFYVENAGALFNTLLLLAFSMLSVRLVRKGLGLDTVAAPGWGLAAVAVLSVTVANTTFVQKVIFTAYADLPTAAALAAGAVFAWFMVEALAAGDDRQARVSAVQMGLAMAALIGAKQANLVLAVFTVAGLMVAAWRDPGVRLARLVVLLPFVVGPAVVVYAVWQFHVNSQLGGGGAQSVLPFANWQIARLPDILATMAGIMARKGAYFGLMAVIVAFAGRALWRFSGAFDRLALIAATIFVGYTAFLVFAYVAVFGGDDGVNAVSYWRYNHHLGLLGVVCTVYGATLLWRRTAGGRDMRWAGRAAVVLVLVLPVVFAPKLRFDLRAPKTYVKAVGRDLAGLLPAGARLFVLDPLDVGFYAKIIRYEIDGTGRVVGWTTVHHENTEASTRAQLADVAPSHVWVHTQVPGVAAAFDQPLAARTSHLLAAEEGGWRLIKSWPYPGYDKPQDVPD